MSKEVSVIQVPMGAGQSLSGVERGSSLLISFGLLAELRKLGWDVELQSLEINPPTHPETEDIGSLKNPIYVGEVCKRLSREIHPVLANKFTLTLGGDHSLSTGSVSGNFRNFPDLYVVWVDAHADINTPETSPSGNIHGMPVALFTGLAKNVPGFEWLSNLPVVPLDRIIYFGLRDLDPAEKKAIRKHNITAFSMSEIDSLGLPACVELALQKINGKHIHLSLDIDALDPSVIFSTGTKCIGGLTFREGRFLCETLAATGQLVSMDLVELNPQIGTAVQVENTVQSCKELILAAMGKTLL